jgi:hypothetical protein
VVQFAPEYSDYKDYYESYDGIYFSDDGGSHFTKVYNLNGPLYADDNWAKYKLNVSTLASGASLDLTSKFVIRFQHYGDGPIAKGGFAFDDICVDGNNRYEENPGEDVTPAIVTLKCYPNPFNPEITICYSLSESCNEINIKIFNIKGQLVKDFSNCPVISGEHLVVWRGVDEQGSNAGSGIYLVRISSGDTTEKQKIILLK